MRGKGQGVNPAADVFGITPACAGKRQPLPGYSKQTRDHPRVCGEKSAVSGCCAATSGSPPRVRGKAGLVQIVGRLRRITPACAGKSTCMAQSLKPREHHPRVCGEKVGPVGCVSGWLGSPPRMRGKAPSLAVLGACIGITPAYAGKSTDLQRPRAAQQDHPRVCGEKRTQAHPAKTGLGSPPRMRGKAPQFRRAGA